MNTALSVLLPVYNAQHSLETGVTEILELLPELTDRFELCILDDGSTDDTAEVARDLAARYPQIIVIRHPLRLGLAESIQTGLDHTQDEVVLIGDEDYNLEPDDLRTLWQLRDTQRRLSIDTELVAYHERWIDKLSAWKPRRADSRKQGGFQVIRRQTFEHFRLEQAVAMITRIDRGNRAPGFPESSRPNFLANAKHLAPDE
ncbi:MAG: glycosyltransferase family 2 protein [Planctomycetia bacterium]|nr:glycosyltransferase family 2 protein [Planctomycetia bacterium]